MHIQVGQIVKNLIPNEPVTINSIQTLGDKTSIKYTGVNSNRKSSKILSAEQLAQLEILTDQGSFNFKGDPTRFALLSAG